MNRLFVGDDWAEDHHDVEVMDATGRRLARARVDEGVAGMARLHALIGEFVDDAGENAPDATGGTEVLVCIETDRGPWVQALVAAGYVVLPVNPLQAARYRERLSLSGAKSDPADAHVLADMARTSSHELRPMAGDSEVAEAIKVVTRAHKRMIWERTRHMQRLRNALREYFPAALAAFGDLTAPPEALELLAKAPDPVSAAGLTKSQIIAALKRARRRNSEAKAAAIQAALRSEQLGRARVVTGAHAATVRAEVAILVVVIEQVGALESEVETHFGLHPDAEVYTSQPGLGVVLAARVLAEFGRRPDPLRGRRRTEKLRRNVPDHPPVGQETRRAGPLRPQRPARRRVVSSGLHRPHGIAGGARLLRQTTRPRSRAPGRPPPAREPPRRAPPRLLEDPHPLRGDLRLARSLPGANSRLT